MTDLEGKQMTDQGEKPKADLGGKIARKVSGSLHIFKKNLAKETGNRKFLLN